MRDGTVSIICLPALALGDVYTAGMKFQYLYYESGVIFVYA